jgi:hypothetical protein
MYPKTLLERNETGGVGGTNTGSSVLNWATVYLLGKWFRSFKLEEERENLLRDREFSQVVSDHLRLDFNLVELLSGVDTDDTANHFRNDNHVTKVSLDQIWLLVGLGLLLSLTELLDKTHRLALQTAVEPTAGTGVDNIAELVGGEIEESEYEG